MTCIAFARSTCHETDARAVLRASTTPHYVVPADDPCQQRGHAINSASRQGTSGFNFYIRYLSTHLATLLSSSHIQSASAFDMRSLASEGRHHLHSSIDLLATIPLLRRDRNHLRMRERSHHKPKRNDVVDRQPRHRTTPIQQGDTDCASTVCVCTAVRRVLAPFG